MSETATPDTQNLRICLEALAAQLGKVPTVVDMHKHGNHHPQTYVDHYGSWEDALQAAGLDPDEIGAKKYPDHVLLAELQRLEKELGHSPTKEDMNDYGKYAPKTYQDRFGSWTEAKQEAMLDTYPISDTELCRELQRLADDLGRRPEVGDMKELGEYGVVTYYRRFGSWDEALAEAGVGQ